MKESSFALRIFRASELSNRYEATFKYCGMTDVMFLDSVPFSTFDLEDTRFIIYPVDLTKVGWQEITSSEMLCVFVSTSTEKEPKLLASITRKSGLHLRFRLLPNTKIIYLCTGPNEKQCEQNLTLFLIK